MALPRRTLAEFWRRDFSAGGQPLTQFFSQRLGACIAYTGYRLGLSPSALTIAGGAIGVGASVAYALLPPGPANAALLVLAYQLAYGFDCADGQLARASKRTSEFGAWLDVTVDYVRYIAIGYAIFVVLLREHAVSLSVALGISGAFLIGTVVSLHTSISLQRQAQAAGHPGRAPPSPARNILRTVFDTPFLLLMLCLLRDVRVPLLAYVLSMGVGNLIIAVLLAKRRFAAP